mmetsp:Transcript_47942/g.141570  ORF Transcript_47942/g.141570 Transcript_47942/m.141570 type:complete len:264 (-) Transcript_47942:222-1013(-)
MALARSRLRCTAASMRRSCSTLREGSLPDRSTRVSSSLASMALTKYSPACAVIPFFESMSTRREVFTISASASLMMPFWSLPLAVRLLLSRFSECRLLFFLRASPIAAAAVTPRMFPSSSSFCRNWLYSSISARFTPSSSFKPLRFRSMDMQVVFGASACASRRRRAPLSFVRSSMPQVVMCSPLQFLESTSRIWSRPPSIFFFCSSSSRRLRSCSFRACSSLAFCFLASCSSLRRFASSLSLSFLRFSAASFFLFSSSIFRF